MSFPSGDTFDRIEHKRHVLATHCATVGRDPDEIAVTYKAVVAIAETTDGARAEWEGWRVPRGIPDVGATAGVFVGSPGEIAEQLEPWLHLGIDHFVLELVRTDPASIALAGQTLSGLHAMAGAR